MLTTKLMQTIARAYWQTFQLLPNLRHIETAISTHYYQCLATARDIVAQKLRVYVDNGTHNAVFSEEIALTSAYALVLSSCPLRVKSLKFRQVLLMEDVPECYPIPAHIDDLSIDFQIPADCLVESDGQRLLAKAVREWREQLRSLPLLRSLSIDFRGSWDEINHLPLLSQSPFYIQNLLPHLAQDPDSSSVPSGTQGSGKARQSGRNGPAAAFPHLAALALRNVPADPFALIDFVATHHATLKRLVLHRISLDLEPDMNWARVGTALAECVPNLAYLELWRNGMHWRSWHNAKGEMVEEGNEDACQRMVAHKLLDDGETELVYQNAGWAWG